MFVFGLVGIILGTVLGSLVKALGDRSLKGDTFLGRSYCPKCKKALRWYDLFPIVSYLVLSGKCRYCKKGIGKEYLLVEVLTGLLVGFLFWQASFLLPPLNDYFKLAAFIFENILKIFFIVVLLVVALTDFKETIIPDRIILPSILISFLGFLALTAYKIWYLYYFLSQTPIGRALLLPDNGYFTRHALLSAQPLMESVAAGLLIGGFFLTLIIITRGKGMGGGDVKLGAFIGLNLGLLSSLIAVSGAFLIGAIFALGLVVLGKKHFGQSIPFGPFLVIGSLLALFWGDKIISWYLKVNGG